MSKVLKWIKTKSVYFKCIFLITYHLFILISDIYFIFIQKKDPSLFILLTLMAIFSDYMLYWNNDERVDKYFRIKKISDAVFITCTYFVYSYVFQDTTTTGYIYLILISAFLLITYILGFNLISKAEKSKDLLYICINNVITIIISFAELNQFIYRLDNNSYNIENVSNWYNLAFDFIYYTFTNTITYGSAGIEPVSILAKLLQMSYIAVFYCFIGDIFIKVITNKIEQSNEK